MTTAMRPLAVLAASSLVLGLAGCAHLTTSLAKLIHPAHQGPGQKLEVRAVAVDLPPVAPYAAEDRLYAQAVKYIDSRNYGQAMELLQLARESRANDPRVLTAMAVVYDKLGRFDLSDRYYDQAEKADPGSRIVALDRRYSLFLRTGGKAGDAGPAYARAAASGKAQSRTASATATSNPGDSLYARAVNAIQQRQYGEALTILRTAKESAPSDPRVLAALGVTYDHLGRFDLSGRYYALAEKADPGSVVVAQDRRNSLKLQQHGGVVLADEALASAPPQSHKLERLARATPAKVASHRNLGG